MSTYIFQHSLRDEFESFLFAEQILLRTRRTILYLEEKQKMVHCQWRKNWLPEKVQQSEAFQCNIASERKTVATSDIHYPELCLGPSDCMTTTGSHLPYFMHERMS